MGKITGSAFLDGHVTHAGWRTIRLCGMNHTSLLRFHFSAYTRNPKITTDASMDNLTENNTSVFPFSNEVRLSWQVAAVKIHMQDSQIRHFSLIQP